MGKKNKQRVYRFECPYCGELARRVNGTVIYPHRPDLAKLVFYSCQPCGAYVGTHRNTGVPLGIPANHALRRARNEAHAAFDPLWIKGPMNRMQAYDWMARVMGVKVKDAHIGMFNINQCRELMQHVANFKGVTAKYKSSTVKFVGDDPNYESNPFGRTIRHDRKPDANGDAGGGGQPASGTVADLERDR